MQSWRFLSRNCSGIPESSIARKMNRGKMGREEKQNGYAGAVSLHEARNPRAEAQYVAEGIRYLVREKGYRYRDIAVITADMNVYADALEKACGLFDIPVFMDHKKSILLNAFVEYLRSLLAMAEENFTYDSVFRFFADRTVWVHG